MKVLVCGGRHYGNVSHVSGMLSKLHRLHGLRAVIQGGANGADRIARIWAEHNHVDWITFEADWAKHGRAAGPKRNQEMLDESKPDLVLAFPGGRGTADMIRRAREAGVAVEICEPRTIQ
jgi:hypothetical protein